uniref:Uncharacterized protein n=1 Tax=Oryza rufipogon TaxID=4529 RepID=A0A0E0QUR3_ORYRU
MINPSLRSGAPSSLPLSLRPGGCLVRGIMPAGDNPHSISEKKAALRESPKEPKNVGNQQPRTSPFPKDKAAGTVGIKRPQPNGPLNPANPGTNGHLVYVRRRLETDHSKVSSSASADSISSLSSKKTVVDRPQEQGLKHQNSSLQTPLAPAAAAATSPASPSGGSPPQNSLRKQSLGKVVVQPSIIVTASPPPRNVVSTTSVPQNSIAAKLACSSVAAASPPPRNLVSTTPVPRNSIAANLASSSVAAASPPPRNLVSTTPVPHNSIAANLASSSVAAASPPPRNLVSTTPVPRNPIAANVASSSVAAASPPRNLASTTKVSQNSIAANLASSSVSATSTSSRGAAPACYPVDPQRSSNQDWKERFIRLQAFLRNNEQSGQEEYIHMLRSLSSVGRSKLAIELENRAVKLLIEEGKELQKMKVLNVLNKLSPTDALPLPTQPASVRHLAFPPR